MRKLVLFDIDGTLVLTGAAGLRAMNKACAELVGHADALAGIPVAGRTDRIILSDVAERAGRPLDAALLQQLREKYVVHLREEIQLPGRGTKAVMPGVRPLLDALARRDDVFVGLLTGNFESGARIKLEYFDLWHYFRCGAFGDDSADRNALVPFALERARGCGLPDIAVEHILVVGDTPHDVACARAVGAVPVAVATGTFTTEQLRATGAEIVFRDLSDTDVFLKLVDA
jgi:phosphoglycolate phosphatase-like HAD superfamily hydrolase